MTKFIRQLLPFVSLLLIVIALSVLAPSQFLTMDNFLNVLRRSSVNAIIAKLDDGGKTIKYLDIGERFLDKEGNLSKELMPDLLHLSERGYEIWADAITPTLTEMLK